MKTNLKPGVALLSVFASLSFAEQPIELDELVVTAGLEPLSIRDVASSVTVITREQIEQKQVKYLADLLRDVPGFAVSQAGGAGAQTQVRVRGSEANQLLVLVDGIRANDPASADEFQYGYALTSDIERIEIIRGPQSATWGTDALAGVINIIRRRDVRGNSVSGRAEIGSFDSHDVAFNGALHRESLKLSGGVSQLKTDGTNIARVGDERDGSENTTASGTVEFQPGDAWRLTFSGQHTDASSDFDDIDYFVTGLPADADRVTEARQTYLRGDVRFDPADSAWSGNVSLNYADTHNQNFADGLWSSSTAAQTMETRLRASVLPGEHGAHRLTFAVDHQQVDFRQRGLASFFGDPNQDQSYDVTGYAAEYVGKPVDAFSWTLSARRDDFSAFDHADTWQAAGSYQLFANLRLRGSLGTGSKAPTFTERFGFYEGSFIGNPNLKPETSEGWEVGIDLLSADQRFTAQLAWFDQRLEDEIDGFVFDPSSGLFTARNKLNPSQRKGLELVLDGQLGKGLGISASYTWTDATEIGFDGLPVPEVRRPEHVASLSANYRFADERANLNLNVNYTGHQFDLFFDPQTFVSETVTLPNFTVVDLAGAWRLNDALELVGRISNLTDRQYEEILGFARPGRAVYGGLRGRFSF